jgi:hypothetical protein
MDAAAHVTRDALAAKYGHVITDSQPRGFRRGYAFADTTPQRELKDAADEAYEAKRAYMQNAWRKDATDDDALPPTQHARAVADRAYAERTKRMQNAWRQK